MKTAISYALAAAFALASTSAFACPMNKSASANPEQTVASASTQEEEGMSTFDPQVLQDETVVQETKVEE